MLFLSIFKRFLRRQPLPGRTVIAPKSTQNEYKFITKTYQKHDTFRNRLLVRFSFIFAEENTSRGQPGGATWGRLGPSWAFIGRLRASLRRLGGILWASWGVLGRLGGVLGCLRASWVRLVGVSGTYWGFLGCLGASWSVTGASSPRHPPNT